MSVTEQVKCPYCGHRHELDYNWFTDRGKPSYGRDSCAMCSKSFYWRTKYSLGDGHLFCDTSIYPFEPAKPAPKKSKPAVSEEDKLILSCLEAVDELSDKYLPIESIENGVYFEFRYTCSMYLITFLDQVLWSTVNDGWLDDEDEYDVKNKDFKTRLIEFCGRAYTEMLKPLFGEMIK